MSLSKCSRDVVSFDGTNVLSHNLVIGGLKCAAGVSSNYVTLIFGDGDDSDRHVPMYLFITVDISGSMDTIVSAGEGENDGYTRLDLAKIAMTALIYAIPEDCYVAIAVFNDGYRLLEKDLLMNAAGKERANKIITDIRHCGGTNMWNASQKMFEEIKEIIGRTTDIAAVHSIILTDGESYDWPDDPTAQPSSSPASGYTGYGYGGYGGYGGYCPQSSLTDAEKALRWRTGITKQMIDTNYGCTFNVIGFSNSVKSDVLENISKSGNGMFGYIPDGSVVISVISNMLANLLSTYIINATAMVEFSNGETKRVNVGSVRYGTFRSCVVDIPNEEVSETTARPGSAALVSRSGSSQLSYLGAKPSAKQSLSYIGSKSSSNLSNDAPARRILPYQQLDKTTLSSVAARGAKLYMSGSKARVVSAVVTYVNPITKELITMSQDNVQVRTVDAMGNDLKDSAFFPQIFRQAFAETIDSVLVPSTPETRLAIMQSYIRDLTAVLSAYDGDKDGTYYKSMLGFLQDAEDQVIMAVSPRYYNEWGAHYLRMLARCHATQYCGNFKDPGVQQYLSCVGKTILEEIKSVLETMPFIPPSKVYQATRQPPTSSAAFAGVYNNSAGSCFLGKCNALTPEGSKCLSDIRVGDTVCTPNGTAKVTHVLRNILNREIPMVQFASGLVSTPYHPVRVNGEWVFPLNTQEEKISIYAESVFSFALDSEHVMIIDGVEAVCLGHGFLGPVIEHSYFGSKNVLDDLDRLSSNGYVEITPEYLGRSPETGLICSIAFPV